MPIDYSGRTGIGSTVTTPDTRTAPTITPYQNPYLLGRAPTSPSISSISSNPRAPVVGSQNYTPTISPMTSGTAGRTYTGNSYVSSGPTSGYNPTSQPPTGAFPQQGTMTPELQQMMSYWNQYAPANNQGSAMENAFVNPDGTISYSFGQGQMYTKAPQDFNAMLKSMGTYTNQTSNVPLYAGQYAPTNVPGQYYGGSNSPWSPTAANLNYTPQQPISPYGSAGNSGVNPYSQQGSPYAQASGQSNQLANILPYIMQMLGQNYGGRGGVQGPQYVGVGGNQSRYAQDPYTQLMSMLQGGQQAPNYYGY